VSPRAAIIFPIVGGLLLLAAWFVQQTLLASKNDALHRIEVAEGNFATYQSGNAEFNAARKRSGNPDPLHDPGFSDQVRNYETGLKHLEEVLDPAAREGIPQYNPTSDNAALLDNTQTRLEAIQTAVKAETDSLEADKKRINTIFVVLYVVGSIAVLIGTVAGFRRSAKA
jgi:hypothetical protein